jgi:hypothetical protein
VKREEKRVKKPTLRSRGFLRKIGLFGVRILDFDKAEFGSETKNGQT